MKRLALTAMALVFSVFSLVGCQMGEEVEVEPTSEALTNCQRQCIQILLACYRQAQTPEDQEDCILQRDACLEGCAEEH